jgi:hypothetical protein
MTPADLKGVTSDELVVLEQVFNLNVNVYDLQKTEAGKVNVELVRRSPYKYDDTMNVNLYEQHFSYIKDLRSYVRATCVRNVTGCGSMLGCCTDIDGTIPEMLSTIIMVACTIQQRP